MEEQDLDIKSENSDQEAVDDRFKSFSGKFPLHLWPLLSFSNHFSFKTVGKMANLSDNNDNDDDEDDVKIDLTTEKAKSKKGGVIYMGFIPEGMTIRNIRILLGKYGEMGRIYLEREGGAGARGEKLKRKSNKFVEGWIEFKKKSVAKTVAAQVNGQPIGGKRRTKFYGALWNLKYLKRFKWSHLAEQMAYEKAMRDQRLRLEINQAKKEADFYANMIDRSRNKREIFADPNRAYRQRQTDEQIVSAKQQQHNSNDTMDDRLLESIFK